MNIWDLRNSLRRQDGEPDVLDGSIKDIDIETFGPDYHHIHLFLDTGYEVEISEQELEDIEAALEAYLERRK